MEQDVGYAALEDHVDVLLFEYGLAVDNDVVALDRHDFARIFVDEVLDPGLQDAGGELAAQGLLEVGLVDLDFLGQAEDLDDVLVAFKSDGTQQRGHR